MYFFIRSHCWNFHHLFFKLIIIL